VAQVAALRKVGKKSCSSPPAPSARAWVRWVMKNVRAPRRIAGVRRRRPVAPHGDVCRTFARHNLHVAQVLLTHDDLDIRTPPQRAQYARHAAWPRRRAHHHETTPCRSPKSSSATTNLVRAGGIVAACDLLVILTTVDGVIENFGKANPKTNFCHRKD